MWKISISNPLDHTIEIKVRDSFAHQSMMTTLGAQMTALAFGEATITAGVSDGFKQQQGFAHGGLVFSLADSAAGYAALTVLPLESEVMTAELKINYLSAGQGTLVAVGRVLKPGRRLIVVAADVWAQHNGKRIHVAALQGTMVPVNR
jgi:uncharacterized protein (TIGR00369 family)